MTTGQIAIWGLVILGSLVLGGCLVVLLVDSLRTWKEDLGVLGSFTE